MRRTPRNKKDVPRLHGDNTTRKLEFENAFHHVTDMPPLTPVWRHGLTVLHEPQHSSAITVPLFTNTWHRGLPRQSVKVYEVVHLTNPDDWPEPPRLVTEATPIPS